MESLLEAAYAEKNCEEALGDGQKKSCKEEQAKPWHVRLGKALPVRTVRYQLNADYLPLPKSSQEECHECTGGKYRKSFSGILTGMTRVGKLHIDTNGQVEEGLLMVINTF